MGFTFNLNFSGLIVFSFPDPGPSKGRAHLVRTQIGDALHRPCLTYDPNQLKNPNESLAPDPLYADRYGQPLAHRDLWNEVLTLDPTFDPEIDSPLALSRAPEGADLVSAVEEAIDPPDWMDYVSVLSKIEPGIAQPGTADRERGLLPSCLARSISPDAPIAARIDFAHGRLFSMGADGQWVFRRTDRTEPGTENGLDPILRQPLAGLVRLQLRDLRRLILRSDQRGDLVFESTSSRVEINVAITNDPTKDFKPSLTSIDHFHHLYQIVQMNQSASIHHGLRSPHLPPGAFQTVGNLFCPPSVYAMP